VWGSVGARGSTAAGDVGPGATTTGRPADPADTGVVNTAVIGGGSAICCGFGAVVGVARAGWRTTMVVGVGNAAAVSAKPTATRTLTPNTIGRADRTVRFDGMATALSYGEVASCLVDRSPTPVGRRVFEPGVPSRGRIVSS